MKSALFFLAFAIVAVNAAVLPDYAELNDESKLQLIQDMRAEVEAHKATLLERLYQPAPFEQTENINAALHALQTRDGDTDCTSGIEPVLNLFYADKQLCRATTHKEVEDIILDIGIVLDMIILDAYELTLMYKECEAKENDVDKGFCFTRWAFEIFNCIDELRLTIRDMVNSSNAQMDALVLENEMCADRAVTSAVEQLQQLYDSCATE